jgi:hypothetical protein
MFKKILAGIALFGLLAVIIAPTYAQKPQQAQGPHEILTGDVTAIAGSTTLTLIITAHDTNPAKGNVSYSNSAGKYFEGNVDCYHRDGNIVLVGGNIIPGGSYNESRFGVEIDMVQNKIRVPTNENYDCTFSNSWGATITENNLVLHEVPENAPLPGSQPVQQQAANQNGNTNTLQVGKHNKVTGNVIWTAQVGTPNEVSGIVSTFDAHEGFTVNMGENENVKPDWGTYYAQRDVGSITGEVRWVNVHDENVAWFGGLVVEADGTYVGRLGQYFVVHVVGNGTPGSEGPDKIGVNYYTTDTQAKGVVVNGTFIGKGVVTDGNLVVHYDE